MPTDRAPGRRASLVRRLTQLNLLVLSLTLLVAFAMIAVASWLAARERQVAAAQLGAALLVNNLAPIIAFDDPAAAQQELNSFARRGDLLWVEVLRADGSVFARWPSQPADAPRSARPTPYEDGSAVAVHADGTELELHAPIDMKGERIGAIRWREGTQGIQHFMLQMTGIGALILCGAILAAAWVLLRVQRRALAPIVELSDLAERVALRQDYGERAVVRRRDEVGRLAERFNAMLKRIEVWQGELHEQLHQEQVAGQQFQALAHRDSLTHLPNRLSFQSELQRMVADSVQQQELMALMFIDLDNFKTVNDSFGHEMGDRVLCALAERMVQVLRAKDVLFRLGGDEFALLVPGLPEAGAATLLADRLLGAVREPLRLDGHLMPVGATIGLAYCPLHATEAMDLLKLADAAMYAAKRAGKNSYRSADDAMA